MRDSKRVRTSFIYAPPRNSIWDVCKQQFVFPWSSQRMRGSRKTMNRKGLRVSPWTMIGIIEIGFVVPMCWPLKEVGSLCRYLQFGGLRLLGSQKPS